MYRTRYSPDNLDISRGDGWHSSLKPACFDSIYFQPLGFLTNICGNVLNLEYFREHLTKED